MKEMNDKQLPPGRQVYDAINGLRVGAFAGLALGAILAAITRSGWFLLIGAVAGAAVGYFWERRKIHEDLAELRPKDDETE